ncbi:hypothetical protein GPECTOR_32g474 [Gonium pectorale]|uniref:Uncharacterized protein n=1 Tax=Gonium pectorale TaxID=33097 RepID=A0A150GDC6_GONPE|nr:hypothetical protein GPECTOR_32g474 [Gonium pectorale]|eukprot:KXZ47861.1 hypothetical protein GPECTOR_32g474 [Gonium pectorale]
MGGTVVLISDLGITAPRGPRLAMRPLKLVHPDPAMVSLAAESSAYWRGLAAQTAGNGAALLADSRSLDVGPARGGGPAGELLGRLQDASRAAGVRLGALRPDELSALFPALRPPGGAVGLLQPEGGVLLAEPAESLLRSLCERQGVLVRDRLVLAGWRDAGSHFVLRAAGSLLRDAVSYFEVEQLLLAPGEGGGPGGWPRAAMALFGADAELQSMSVSTGRCAATSELSSLPLWRYIGNPLPPGGGEPAPKPRAQEDDAAPGSRRKAGAASEAAYVPQLQLICGYPAQVPGAGGGAGGGRGGGGGGAVSMQMDLGAVPLAGGTAARAGPGLGSLRGSGAGGGGSGDGEVANPWALRPGAADRGALTAAHRLAGQLLRGVGPPLLPTDPGSRAASSSSAWGEAALHVGTPDGWPAVGWLPGTEPGRVLFVSTASCATGARAAQGRGEQGAAAAAGAKEGAGPSGRGAAAGKGSGDGDEREPSRAVTADGDRRATGADAADPGAAAAAPGPEEYLGHMYDGYQLSPLLAKMAADMMCGAPRVAEADPERLDLGRSALVGMAQAEGLDSWEGLGRWQRGEALAEALTAAAGEGDGAEARERAEALARGGRMFGADAGAEGEGGEKEKWRSKVFLPTQ